MKGNQQMGPLACLGLCLLGCLVFNPLVEGAQNGTVADRSRCPPGVLYYKQFCYQYVSSFIPWHLAEVACQELKSGGEAHLASVLSPNEGRIVASFLQRSRVSNVWIGLEATRGNGYMVWEWSDAAPLSLPLWDGRSVSTAVSSYECISMVNIDNSKTQKWLQRACSDTLPYLCKYKSDY